MHGKGEVPLLQAALTAQPLQDAHNGAKSLQQAKNANLRFGRLPLDFWFDYDSIPL